MSIIIRQPKLYFDYDMPDWADPYDQSLILCECGNLCEKGIGRCELCIDKITKNMQKDLSDD